MEIISGIRTWCRAKKLLHPHYVVGFNFIKPSAVLLMPFRLVLIRKLKPAWQLNKLNGIGGKVEPGESPLDAMRREYIEETGDEVTPKWQLFCCQRFDTCTVHFFKAFSENTTAHTVERESVEIVELADYILDPHTARSANVIPNLRWLVPMAFYTDDIIKEAII